MPVGSNLDLVQALGLRQLGSQHTPIGLALPGADSLLRLWALVFCAVMLYAAPRHLFRAGDAHPLLPPLLAAWIAWIVAGPELGTLHFDSASAKANAALILGAPLSLTLLGLTEITWLGLHDGVTFRSGPWPKDQRRGSMSWFRGRDWRHEEAELRAEAARLQHEEVRLRDERASLRDEQAALQHRAARIGDGRAKRDNQRRWLEEQLAIDEYCRENGIDRDDRPCYVCFGTGRVEEDCGWCYGSGYRDFLGKEESCVSCGAIGKEEKICSSCGGSGDFD
jgi:hypothetical protein